jgi:glucuronate isomerase
MNVVLICTTDDPCDDLDAHRALQNEGLPIQVYPTFRPDKGMAVDSPQRFNEWVDELAAVADVDIRDFDTFLFAFRTRHDYFHKVGCRLSDHGLGQVYAEDYTEPEIQGIFNEVRMGNPVDREKVLKFKSAMLYEFALMDHEKGWTQQFHLGALRNTNSRMYDRLGPDTGFDSIGDFEMARPLVALFDRLDRSEQLPKTILYNLNPKDNAVLATLSGNYQDGQTPGKMQFGSGWWFLDQKDGMEEQMEILSNMGLLSLFVGMLTDSRSFLSYTRHEYFRRILCNLLGSEIEQGLLPDDLGMVGAMVKDICYNNAARYFGFELPVQE